MIPKRIHQIWIQGYDAAPQHIRSMLDKCKSLNSSFEYLLWDDHTIKTVFDVYGDKELHRLYDNATNMAAKADIARYMLVYLFGGIYLDADTECIKSLDTFTSTNLFYIEPRHSIFGTMVDNLVFGAKKRHPLLEYVLHLVKYRGSRNERPMFLYRTTHFTGTELFHRAIERYHKRHPNDIDYLVVGKSMLHPCDSTVDFATCRPRALPTAFTIHANHMSWVDPVTKRFHRLYSLQSIGYLLSIVVALVCLLFLKNKA